MRLPLALSLILLSGVCFAQEPVSAPHLPGEVIVRVSDGLERAAVDQIALSVGASVDRKLTRWDLYLFRFNQNTPVVEVVRELQSFPDVRYAEPNALIPVNQIGFFGEDQGGISTAAGAGVIVAVIDTGIDFTHSVFTGKLYSNPGEIAGDGIDNDSNGLVDDVRGWDFFSGDNNPTGGAGGSAHGTQVAGRVLQGALDAAVKILPLRVGVGPSLSLAAILEAVEYAVAQGAHIINMSFGSSSPLPSLEEALEHAHEAGVLLIASAGNGNSSVASYPAVYSQVVSVAASDSSGAKASFSSYGSTVDFTAPGEDVSTPTFGGGNATVDGTSFAAPYLAGVAARVLSALPDLTQAQVLDQIASFAKDVDELNPGFEGLLGRGLVDEEVAEDLADALPLEEEEPDEERERLEQELEEARAELEQLEEDLAAAEVAYDAAQDATDQAEEDYALAKKNVKSAQKEFDGARKAYNNAGPSTPPAQKEQLRQQMEDAEAALEEAKQLRDEALDRLRAAQAAESAAKQQVRQLKKQVGKAEDKVADLEQELASLSTFRAETEQLIQQLQAIDAALSAGLPEGLSARSVSELALPEVGSKGL